MFPDSLLRGSALSGVLPLWWAHSAGLAVHVPHPDWQLLGRAFLCVWKVSRVAEEWEPGRGWDARFVWVETSPSSRDQLIRVLGKFGWEQRDVLADVFLTEQAFLLTLKIRI